MDIPNAHQPFVKIDFVCTQVQGFNGCPHIFASPSIFLNDRDIIEFDLFEVKVNVLFLFGRWRSAEIIENKLVIPNRVSAVEMNGCILQRDIFQFHMILEKEVVGDVHLYSAGIQQRVFKPVLDQRAFEEHTIEQCEVYVADANSCIEVIGELPGHLPDKKILNGRGLNKEPHRYNQYDQNQQSGAAYFPEFSQAICIAVKVTINLGGRKFSTIEL
jgi:hypothetical protein